MTLAASIAAHRSDVKKGPRCTVDVLMEQLAAEDRKAFEAALVDKSFATASLLRALRDEGYDVGYSTLQRHRNGECKG